MCQCLHADLVVGTVQAHGLFRHGTLQCVLGCLVVIRERNDRTSDSEQHGGMNLTMGVPQPLISLQVTQIHSNQTSLFLLYIQILNQPLILQVSEGKLPDQIRSL